MKDSRSRFLTLHCQLKRGFTLIEMLVVLFAFSILGIVTTQSLMHSLRASRKSDAMVDLNDNIDYAVNVIERSLRTAKSIDRTACDGYSNDLVFIREDGTSGLFSCSTLPAGGVILLDSSPLTSDDVNVTCTNIFNCVFPVDSPDYVDIAISATSTDTSGAEGASVNYTTRIMLRNYR